MEYFSLRIIPKILVPDRTIFSICECHCPVLLKITPRCLWLSTKLIGILSKTSCGKILIFLKVNKTASVFSGLNVTSHCLAQYYVPKSSILLTGTGVWKSSSVACGFSSIKIDYSDYSKSLISRINEV